MQEWVDTLRSKLREMKILSPKENLYSKLPEVRPPLLPTRDPMSPLPETPAIPAAIPGVERVVSTIQTSRINNPTASNAVAQTSSTATNALLNTATPATQPTNAENAERPAINRTSTSSNNGSIDTSSEINDFDMEASTSSSMQPTTSNTLTHNLIKMLYPVTKYSQHANDINIDSVIASANESNDNNQSIAVDNFTNDPNNSDTLMNGDSDVSSLARTFANNVLSDPTAASTPKRNQATIIATNTDSDEVADGEGTVFPIYPTPEPLVIPRPQTSRTTTSKKYRSKSESSIEPSAMNEAPTTNITIIQVSSTIAEEKTADDIVDDQSDSNFTNNVQIIPSNYMPTEENAIITVQVTSDPNTNHTIAADAISTERLPLNGTTTESQDGNSENTQQFTGITNISIGINDRSIVQQIKPAQQPEQMHYEQVFVTQIPSTSTIKSPNDEQQSEQTHSKELHVNRIKLNKSDNAHVSTGGDVVGPSTSHTSTASATITFSIAATTNGSTGESTNNTNAASLTAATKPKEVKIKSANDENAAARRPLLTRGLTEAVILRPSRKDAVRPSAPGNQVKYTFSPSKYHELSGLYD